MVNARSERTGRFCQVMFANDITGTRKAPDPLFASAVIENNRPMYQYEDYKGSLVKRTDFDMYHHFDTDDKRVQLLAETDVTALRHWDAYNCDLVVAAARWQLHVPTLSAYMRARYANGSKTVPISFEQIDDKLMMQKLQRELDPVYQGLYRSTLIELWTETSSQGIFSI